MARTTETSRTSRLRTVRGRLLVAGAVAATALALGLKAGGTAVAAPAGVEGTPCSAAARACVDLGSYHAWLIKDGKVEHGPVGISQGGEGRETPTGDFAVERKDADHKSKEFNNAPMPWAVFFAPGGIAFHEGRKETPSAGCVRLSAADAEIFFNSLQIGDRVEVR